MKSSPLALATSFTVAMFAGAAASGGCSTNPPAPPAASAVASTSTAAALATNSATAPAASSAPQVAATPAPPCNPGADVTVFASPEHPWPGEPLRVLAVSSKPLAAELVLTTQAGAKAATSNERHGATPYWWYAEIAAPAVGKVHAELVQTCKAAKLDVTVEDSAQTRVRPTWGLVWPIHASWGVATENLYSAWIERMFDAPLDAQPSWNALHEVLRDRSRNFLFDYLGSAEDEQDVVVRPDCADLPYFLRAYFAFKLGLPFGWSRCSRGDSGLPPTCTDFASSSDPFPKQARWRRQLPRSRVGGPERARRTLRSTLSASGSSSARR